MCHCGNESPAFVSTILDFRVTMLMPQTTKRRTQDKRGKENNRDNRENKDNKVKGQE